MITIKTTTLRVDRILGFDSPNPTVEGKFCDLVVFFGEERDLRFQFENLEKRQEVVEKLEKVLK